METKNTNENLDKASQIFKKATNKDFVESLVLNIVEKSLPILFWIGVSMIIFLSISEATSTNYLFRSIEMNNSFFRFICYSIIYLIPWIFSFYLLYVLKNIRNNLTSLVNK